MTDEQKKAELEAKKAEESAQDDEPTEEEPVEGESEDEGESQEHIDSEIDYEAELKKEREAREKAEKALAAKRFQTAEKKRKVSDDDESDSDPIDDEDDEEDRPLTKREFQQLLAVERQQTQKEVQATRIREIAQKISKSDAEANLIMEIHKNRSFPQHLSLEDQLEEAYVIANRKKLIGERDEALRALSGKERVNKNPAQTHKSVAPTAEPKSSGQDIAAIKAAGFGWNGVSKRYEKKLSNGDTLYRDPRTKQTVRIAHR